MGTLAWIGRRPFGDEGDHDYTQWRLITENQLSRYAETKRIVYFEVTCES